MQLLSKNATLEESISKMEGILSDLGFEVEYSEEKHPLNNCYSINLASKEAPSHIYSNGKGINSLACKASGLGEYIERLQTNNFFMEFYLPNRSYYKDEVVLDFEDEYLNEELLKIYNANDALSGEDLVDFCSDYEDKIVALPFKNLFNNKIVNFPVNLLHNLYVSNGLSTGNIQQEAISQALSEIIERHVKIQIIKNGYSLPKYDDITLKKFDRVYSDINKLKNLGYIIEVLDASFEGKFPVVAISLINPNNSTLFVSFGAHPILEVAMERTLTELMQGRDLDALKEFETPTFDMDYVGSDSNLESHFIDSNGKMSFDFLKKTKDFNYTSWSYNGNSSEDEVKYLSTILQKLGKDIYLREYSYMGFYSCQIIVPDFSEIYPFEDLIYNNKNSAKFIREMVLKFDNYDLDDVIVSIENLEENIDMGKYLGVIFKNDFTIGEFKAQLYLLNKEYEEALRLLEYSTNPFANVITELLRLKIRNKKFEDYKEGLYNIFSKDKVIKAKNILENKEYFIDLTFDEKYQNILNMYDKLSKKKELD
ncbi:YcaO-like family protein [Arcobacter sp. FWKO B]|uniref:YcaO-like family protein n=1 Tax=Arcobacter sp. FWKO B TaxID=2593672 RepID=UPI0018A46306|nr:YcaO-like family protein [Arcobacter sp. FWKO B]QOG12230.1 hypothetical protein FWKOB_05725 [Arcobacter sp. FWKO B]